MVDYAFSAFLLRTERSPRGREERGGGRGRGYIELRKTVAIVDGGKEGAEEKEGKEDNVVKEYIQIEFREYS